LVNGFDAVGQVVEEAGGGDCLACLRAARFSVAGFGVETRVRSVAGVGVTAKRVTGAARRVIHLWLC
jgi:hypothetical protein